MATPLQTVNFTVEEFLAYDETINVRRLEYHDGHVLEIESATPDHSKLCARWVALLADRFQANADCEVFDGSVNIFVESVKQVVKPDAALLCDSRRLIHGIEGVGAAICNPSVVIEVLSKESENYDKGKKADYYRSIPSLQHYILVSQTAVEIQLYTRKNATTWELETFVGKDQATDFGGRGLIRLSEIYEGMTFDDSFRR